MSEVQLGPNGALLYTMSYLSENLEWFSDQLDDFGDEDYLILDCPGQIELYTHIPIMKTLIHELQSKVCRNPWLWWIKIEIIFWCVYVNTVNIFGLRERIYNVTLISFTLHLHRIFIRFFFLSLCPYINRTYTCIGF